MRAAIPLNEAWRSMARRHETPNPDGVNRRPLHPDPAGYTCNTRVAFLDDLEDIYLAESRLEGIRAGRSRTYTLEEVEQDLGLDSRV